MQNQHSLIRFAKDNKLSVAVGVSALVGLVAFSRTRKGQRMLASILPSSFFSNPYSSLEPGVSASKFVQNFELEYGNVRPNFVEDSYLNAFNRSKTEYKFVVIYLHSWMNGDTEPFCQDILGSEVVSEFLNEHFLVWANDVRSPEGYQLSQSMGATSFPFLAVVTSNSAGGITLLDSIEGLVDTETLLSRLTNVLERHGGILTTARIERETRDMDRRLREEQDLAYQQSLAEDEERARMAQMQVERELEERRRKEEEAANLILRQKDKERRREELAKNLPSEPNLDDKNVVRIAIRFPDGSRLQRRFSSDQRLQTIYDFVESQRADLREFDLVSSHPRKVYSDHDLTLEAVGLVGQSSLFVEEH